MASISTPSTIFADYPSLGRGIILQQLPQQQQQQQQPAIASVATSEAPSPPPKETATMTQPSATGLAPIAARNNNDVTVAKRPQLPAKPQPLRRSHRPSVLLKPQYACFLQNDDATPRSLPATRGPRKAASFSFSPMARQEGAAGASEEQQQSPTQQSKYDKGEHDQLQIQIQIPDQRERRRRPSLPSSLALPNASTALLQARIPGTTLYYV